MTSLPDRGTGGTAETGRGKAVEHRVQLVSRKFDERLVLKFSLLFNQKWVRSRVGVPCQKSTGLGASLLIPAPDFHHSGRRALNGMASK